MRVFRATYTRVTKDGSRETRTAKKWYAEFRGPDGAVRRVPGFADRTPTLELARKLQKLADLRAAGDPPSDELRRWLETLPPRLRAHLGEGPIGARQREGAAPPASARKGGRRRTGLGLVDPSRVAATKPLVEHMGDFERFLSGKRNTPGHVRETVALLDSTIAACGWCKLSDINGGRLAEHLSHLTIARGRSARTSNKTRGAWRSFCRWLVRESRLLADPTIALDVANERVDRRRERRAMTDPEIAALLDATERGPVREGFDGRTRAMLYRVALGTGFRVGELRSLSPRSFDLKSAEPTVTIEAGYSKRRRRDVQPIRPDLAALVGRWLDGKPRETPIWPLTRHTAEMIRADLRAVRAAWLKAAPQGKARRDRREDDHLREVDGAGRRLDFHALRHTYVSRLARAGVTPKVAQTLARHSTITLTLDRYAHIGLADQRKGLDALPAIEAPEVALEARATGTDGQASDPRLAHRLAREASSESAGAPRVALTGGSGFVLANAAEPDDSAEKLAKAAVGFEPTNNGFAIRPLGPLGYAAGPRRAANAPRAERRIIADSPRPFKRPPGQAESPASAAQQESPSALRCCPWGQSNRKYRHGPTARRA